MKFRILLDRVDKFTGAESVSRDGKEVVFDFRKEKTPDLSNVK